MRNRDLESVAFKHYIEELRRGSRDPYLAFRVYERPWELRDGGLARALAVLLVESDPWFLASATPGAIHALELADLERLTPLVGGGAASEYAAYLRAKLWFEATGPRRPAADTQLRRALEFLLEVPVEQRRVDWHEMLVGCYEVLDHDRYKEAFAALFEETSPEWRASPLVSFLRNVAARADWDAFDRFRPEWNRLPANVSMCACNANDVYTCDGHRALALEQWDAIDGALRAATPTRGCAHLNSYGARLGLARKLVEQRRNLQAVRAYLEQALKFGNPDAAQALLQQLDT
jgi:hypothetical protein